MSIVRVIRNIYSTQPGRINLLDALNLWAQAFGCINILNCFNICILNCYNTYNNTYTYTTQPGRINLLDALNSWAQALGCLDILNF